MAVDLNITSYFEISIRGRTISMFQNAVDATSEASNPFVLSVDGVVHSGDWSLDTATARTIWDDDDDSPTDFDFFFFVATQNMFVQVIMSATHFIVPVLAKVPFILAPKTDALTAKALGAASTTAISGSAPSVTEIDSIVIQNNSGYTAYGSYFLCD